MGAGRKRSPTAAAVHRARKDGGEGPLAPSESDRLLEELEHTRLLTDERAWQVAGEELRRRDPTRYVAILRVVEEICQIHRAPLDPARIVSPVMSRGSDDDDFD